MSREISGLFGVSCGNSSWAGPSKGLVGSFLSVFFRLARGVRQPEEKPARSERGIGTCTVDFVWLVLVFGAPASAALRDVLS